MQLGPRASVNTKVIPICALFSIQSSYWIIAKEEGLTFYDFRLFCGSTFFVKISDHCSLTISDACVVQIENWRNCFYSLNCGLGIWGKITVFFFFFWRLQINAGSFRTETNSNYSALFWDLGKMSPFEILDVCDYYYFFSWKDKFCVFILWSQTVVMTLWCFLTKKNLW